MDTEPAPLHWSWWQNLVTFPLVVAMVIGMLLFGCVRHPVKTLNEVPLLVTLVVFVVVVVPLLATGVLR